MKYFVAITERKRKAGKIVGDLYEIKKNRLIRISGFGFSKQSNAGTNTECIKALVTFGALPQQVLTEEFGKNALPSYHLTVIEGTGLNYVTEVSNP